MHFSWLDNLSLVINSIYPKSVLVLSGFRPAWMGEESEIPSLAEVQRFLKHLEYKWYDIGLQLGLDPNRLECIKRSGQGPPSVSWP